MIKIQVKGIKETQQMIKKKFNGESALGFDAQNIKMLNALKANTPIDTGEAQSGWQIVKVGKDKSEIINKVEYIQRLNQGHSRQASAYFVESTAIKFGKPQGNIVTTIPSA